MTVMTLVEKVLKLDLHSTSNVKIGLAAHDIPCLPYSSTHSLETTISEIQNHDTQATITTKGEHIRQSQTALDLKILHQNSWKQKCIWRQQNSSINCCKIVIEFYAKFICTFSESVVNNLAKTVEVRLGKTSRWFYQFTADTVLHKVQWDQNLMTGLLRFRLDGGWLPYNRNLTAFKVSLVTLPMNYFADLKFNLTFRNSSRIYGWIRNLDA